MRALLMFVSSVYEMYAAGWEKSGHVKAGQLLVSSNGALYQLATFYITFCINNFSVEILVHYKEIWVSLS